MPNSNTIMQKYGKKLPGGNLKAVVPFGRCLSSHCPPFMVDYIPMALLEFVASRFKSALVPSKKRLSDFWETGITSRPADALDSSAPRELDLVIYGATGFTGKLMTKYIAENYQGKVKFAIGGRSKEGLSESVIPWGRTLPTFL